MLTQAQLEFLSKYLKYVPSKGLISSKQHDKASKYNKQLDVEFEKYEAAKGTVDDLIELIGSEITLTRAKIKAIPQDIGRADVQQFLKKFGTTEGSFQNLQKLVSEQHSACVNAPEDKPVFGEGERFMRQSAEKLYFIKNGLPKVPTILNDGALPVLYGAKAKVDGLAAFSGSKILNPTIVDVPLEDRVEDNKRADALALHAALCKEAAKYIDALIKSALRSKPPAANAMIDKAEKRIVLLVAALIAPVKALTDAINGQAAKQLEALVSVSPVAKIEQDRMANVTLTMSRIDDLVKVVNQNVKDLKTKFAEATGYKEKAAIQAQLKDEKKRAEDLNAQKVQLQSYEDQLALRVVRIKSGIVQSEFGDKLAADPAKVIKTLDPQPPARGPVDKDSLMGGQAQDGTPVDGRYQNLKKMYDRAAKRVSVDSKLYQDEPDVFDIDDKQLKTLTAMLEAGHKLGKAGDYTKASHLFEESYKLYFTFLSANKFLLPPTAPAVPAADVKLDLAIKSAGAELDEFWGVGGDSNDALRKVLAKITEGRDDKIKNAQTGGDDLQDLQDRVEAFRKDVATQSDNFTPSVLPEGQIAREKAGTTSNTVSKELLKLFQTKPVQLSEIGGIPANKLLTVKNGSKVEYYEIQTKRGGTQDRREDKDIPLEALNMLYERSAMLDLLAQESPVDQDSADAMAKIAEDTEKMMLAIRGGSKDYAHVFDQIKECKKLEIDAIFTEWVPDGLYEAKTDLKTFAAQYPTKYMPAEARMKIDELFKTLTEKKAAAEKLKEDHARVEKIIRAVEYELEPGSKKKATKDTPVLRLEAMMKGGTKVIFAGLMSDPLEFKRLTALENDIKKHLKTLETIGIKDGLEGGLTRELALARQKLDIKSATGIRNAEEDANAIRAKLGQQAKDLKVPPMADLAYLEKVASFLTDLATGAEKAKKDHDDAELARKNTKRKLEAVLKILDDSKATLTAYKEYKTVYDAQKKAYDAAAKDFEKDKMPAAAANDQFSTQLSNATQLADDLAKLTTTPQPGSETVDFGAWQTALTTYITKIRDAAKRAAETLRKKAADDEPTVITAADDAAKVLELAGDAKIAAIVTFQADLVGISQKALILTGEPRKKAMALAREQALVEIRRIRAETDKHPALVVYRDNPIDKGASWPQFASALHKLDVEILTRLNPA